MTAYAIWAPGVGYLTDERYPEDLPISKSNERRHVDDLNRAHVFLSLEAAYSALQVGYTKMAGIEIRRLKPLTTSTSYTDEGAIS